MLSRMLKGAATGGQQLSATANQFVDKIDPFSKRGTSRRRRIVNSSRYHAENEPELVQLPLIKGMPFVDVYKLFKVTSLDTPANEQPALVLQKLVQCQKIFDFYDPVAQLKSKEVGCVKNYLLLLYPDLNTLEHCRWEQWRKKFFHLHLWDRLFLLFFE
ncbi:unnamed protein product [Strongylus vulgaris]|uniref:Uncharacterized protein n=1 Tax=Strongylus vulgaris TaxID=40348 RepID=A0A3P7IW64_STRVU|nr:unnamed protein product [Strongylus vulgaris]